MLDRWRADGIYARIKAREQGRPEFRFIDGPPYTTGSIHLGTAWNKILKDLVIAYRRMRGFQVTDTPGYDTHGLPIEVQMEKRLNTRSKKDIITTHGMDAFVSSCKAFALENLDIMNSQFRRLGCEFWNWERPYVTLHESYVEGCWWMIKQASEQGLLYLGNRPLNTCPRCETALAKHEFEYENRIDTSIYVKFKVIGKDDEHLVIWTTTPWTLVSNMAVMANPEIEYVRVRVKGETWIMARNLAAMFIQAEVGVFPEILETFTGDALAGTRYVHPLLDEVPVQQRFHGENAKVHSVIMSTEFVSATEGTGLVHCAPGHGPEDYQVGHVVEGIPAFSPLDDEGKYVTDAGAFAGKYVFDANQEIIDLLKRKGTLISSGEIDHEYAHCWRCKTPLVYRVLDQWYLKTSALAQRMIEENKKIQWVPGFAGDKNFFMWLQNLQDWCISRQRFWGIPLPIWKCDSEACGDVTVIGSRAELEAASGQHPADLHRPWVDAVTFPCKACKAGTKRRVEDVADVWLDSGCVMWASNEAVYGDDYARGPRAYGEWRPADFILEGKDQIRGWFNSLMSCGMLASGRPTYKTVVMHGFVTFEGEPMHKSRGNVVAPEEAIERRGSETFRLYCLLNMSQGEDLNFYWREFDDSYKVINTLWNCFSYAKEVLALHGYRPAEAGKDAKARKGGKASRPAVVEDAWLLSRLHGVLADATRHLDGFEMARYARVARDFIVNDLSKWHLKLVKPRLSEDADPADRASAMSTLHEVLKLVNVMLAPLLPVVAELLYAGFTAVHARDPKPSVHLEDWPVADPSLVDAALEKDVELVQRVVEATRTLREERDIKLKWPCKQLVVAGPGAGGLAPLAGVLAREANVKDVSLVPAFEPNPAHASVAVDPVVVHLDVSRDESMLAEKFYRDFFRQLQFLRKAASLNVGDLVDLEIATPSTTVASHVEMFAADIKKNAYVRELVVVRAPSKGKAAFEQDLKYCPDETCLVPVKAKTIENAAKAGKPVTCSYCNGEFAVADLVPITVRFKK